MSEMPPTLARDLRALAHSGAPFEICGFVFRDWGYMPVLNVHPEPRGNFAMEPEAMLRILGDGFEHIAGVFHSHPGGVREPSPTDIDGAAHYPAFRYWIVTYADVYEWRIKDGLARPTRRDGTPGIEGMAYPVLAPTEALRREG